jgi:hypothetical protein
MTDRTGCSFRRFFQSADSDRDNFLARLFGSFNEEPVRIWCRDPDSPYEDLGRPTLTDAGKSGRGHTLDFALRSRRDGRIFVAEMKCEITYENYRSMTLRSRSQLDRHARDSEAFRKFLAVAKDPKSYSVTVSGRTLNVDGAILIWGACTQEGRREVVEGTGIAEVLSLEEIIETLVNRANHAYLGLVQKRMTWCQELFDFLSGNPWRSCEQRRLADLEKLANQEARPE